jgi:hypothetical protein
MESGQRPDAEMARDRSAMCPNRGGLVITSEKRAASAEMNGFLIMTAVLQAD